MDQCRATKRDGSRCTLPSSGQQGLCWAHNPANHEKRRRTASRGGKAKATKEVRDLKTSIKELIGKVETGELESTPAANGLGVQAQEFGAGNRSGVSSGTSDSALAGAGAATAHPQPPPRLQFGCFTAPRTQPMQ